MKTLGPRTARLVEALHDGDGTVFTVADAARILDVPANIASNLLAKAQARGVVTRLRRGLFTLVPFEMGSATSHGGDPWQVVDRLLADRPHYFSHGTAMSIHGMTRQPRLLVTASAVAPKVRHGTAGGHPFRIVGIRPDEIFGIEERWMPGGLRLPVSDIERTVVDCLRRPELAGGYIEIDAGAWMVRDRIRPDRLVEHALHLGVGAVIARTGYLLDSCGIGTDNHREALSARLTRTFHRLDPVLPDEGRHLSRWRLRLNVETEEIEAARST